MEGQGPEALLLAARLAEQRALRTYRDLEMNRESSMYVEVCVRAGLEGASREREAEARAGVWDRMVAALHRAAGRAERELADQGQAGADRMRREGPVELDRAARSISAAAVGRVDPVPPMGGQDGPALSLAFYPLAQLGRDPRETD